MLTLAAVALLRFLRERANIFFVFILPFLIILLVGFGSDFESSLGIVGAETEIGAAVLLHLPEDQVVTYDSRQAASQAVEENVLTAAVVFSEDRSEPIAFLSRPGVGLGGKAALDEAVAIENQRIAVNRQAMLVGAGDEDIAAAIAAVPATPIRVERVGTVFFEGLSSFDASSLTQVVLFVFLSSMTAASAVIRDRDLGMTRRKAASPVSTWQLVIGETLGRFSIAAFQAVLIVVVTAVAFGVSWGDPLATGLILVLFILLSTGAGILLGSALDNAEAADGVGIMTGLVLAALGGAMAPVEIFPPVMQTIARFTPHYWAIEGLKISVAGGSVSEVGSSLVVLAAISFGLLLSAVAFYRHKVFGAR